ncbi:PoNe immunity protein domain-containing protein [Aquimarina sp. LLG6339-5]|uniref:PoNe immunity protein domain-containing protein n=1 Tax=Aquimarina sp. LLG6339-5 TaxID=3160830 RepID=UPI00386E2799
MKRSIFKDKQYFDDYIISLTDLRLKMDDKIKNGEIKDSKLEWANNSQLHHLYKLLVARYSRGDKIEILSSIYSRIVENLTNTKWTEKYVKFTYTKHKKTIISNQLSLNFHPILINILSIGVLINAKRTDFENIKKFLDSFDIEYKLFDILLNYKIENHPIRESKYKLSQYKNLDELIEPLKIEKKELINYHLKWYQSLNQKYFNWVDSTIKGNLFYGYWCFESAALAKINSIGISILYSNIYFPTDLYKNDSSHFEYQVTLEHKLLMSIDKTMNDVGKYWKVRNSSNEILKTRRILQRNNKKRYTEIEQQITDYFEKLENSQLSQNKEKILANKPFVIKNLINLLEHNDIEYLIREIETDNNSYSNIWKKIKTIWS